MLAQDLMSKNPITVGLDVEVGELASLFETKNIHHLVVVENKQIMGIISDRDVLRCLSPFANTKAETRRDSFTVHKKAHQIMTHKPITIDEKSPIKQAAELILQNNIGCLPVVKASTTLVGILTWRDLLRFATSRTH